MIVVEMPRRWSRLSWVPMSTTTCSPRSAVRSPRPTSSTSRCCPSCADSCSAESFDPDRAEEAIGDHFDFLITRHDTAPLAERIWSLRHRYTSCDAAYLALAEALDAPLHTCDAKPDSGGHRAIVRVHDRTH